MSKYDYDVIVVGAGPGGSAAAEKCARFGLKTLLLEKEKLPRDKVCGGMICKSIKYIADIYGSQVYDIAERKTDDIKIKFNGEGVLTINHPSFIFSRKKLDYLITRKALEAGAKLIDGCRVDDVVVDDNKVEVISGNGKFVSKIIIGADGVNSVIASRTGLNNGWNKNDVVLAIESEIKMSNNQINKRFGNSVTGYVYDDFIGYEWIIPKDGCVNVGVGTKVSKSANLRDRFDDMVKRLGLEAVEVKAHMVPINMLNRTYRERVILCGDAGGFVYTTTGAGIKFAINSGRAAAEVCYDAIKTDDYSIKVFGKYDIYCKDIVLKIKMSALQMKIFEIGMKYKLLNMFVVKHLLRIFNSTV